MYIIFEEHQYAAEDIKEVLHGISELQDVNQNVSVSYVGYYYEPAIADCVFILPKVLLNEKDELVVGPDLTIDPSKIITPKGQKENLTPEYRKFLYEFATWIYRTIAVYHQHYPKSKAIYYRRLPRVGSGIRHKANTYLDIILSLIQFNQENQDFFLYTLKNIHSGHNKINWTRTISHSDVFLQDSTPIYLSPVNRKRQINFDEELFVIFFSILNYINEEYGFRTPINMQYELLTKSQFETYRKGYGKTRLKELRYKYFSDKAVLLWDLCYAFFDSSYQLTTNTDNKEYLLAKKYNIIFEAMIDELVGTSHNDIPPGLADQDDGKQVDHMYTDLALTSARNREVYYIGDSKYYKMSTDLGKPSVSKQYTYARNVIQWNINLWKKDDEGKRLRGETSDNFRSVRLRPDSSSEGYDIIPNFFLSAFVDEGLKYDRGSDDKGNDLNIKPRKEINPKTKNLEEKTYVSTQFDNRLFDRDTLLLMYYDVNFLFIVRMYARDKASEKAHWKTHVRNIFRKKIQEVLADKFQFYAFAPKASTCAKDYLDKNLKSVIGKVFSPFANEEMFVLALEDNEQERETNEALLTELREHFYVSDKGVFTLGQDPTEQLKKLGYTKGAEKPIEKTDLMFLSSIEAKVNPENAALKNGTATMFVSGHTPDASIDLQRLRYFAPIINHEVAGSYEIVSIGVIYVMDKDHPMRLQFKLKNYRKFRKAFNFGVNNAAGRGLKLSPTQLAKYLEESPTQSTFSFAFDNAQT